MRNTNTLILAVFLGASQAVTRLPHSNSFIGVRFAEGLDGDEYLGKETDITMLSDQKAGD